MFKKNLASIVLAIGLSGCGPTIGQEGINQIAEQMAGIFVKASDNYMDIHKLLKEKKYGEAQKVLEEEITQKLRECAEARGSIKNTPYVSKTVAERVGKTMDAQVEKIQTYLKEYVMDK